MKLLGKQALHEFKEQHADARQQIESWEQEVEGAEWKTPNDLKRRFPKASILKNQLVVFDLCRNKYRLLARVEFNNQIVLVKKLGTHREYDRWNLV